MGQITRLIDKTNETGSSVGWSKDWLITQGMPLSLEKWQAW